MEQEAWTLAKYLIPLLIGFMLGIVFSKQVKAAAEAAENRVRADLGSELSTTKAQVSALLGVGSRASQVVASVVAPVVPITPGPGVAGPTPGNVDQVLKP